MSNDSPIRFAIIGCGVIAPTHAGALKQISGSQLVAVTDVIPERAAALVEQHPGAKVYPTVEDLLADEQIDAVIICTPSGLHADHAIAALKAGKHVIVEKPMEITLSACQRIIAAQKNSNRKLAVISQHRFDSATVLVKQLVETGKLGKIFLATAEVKWWRSQAYYDSGDWRGTWRLDGGGALMNQGIHTVDLLQWLVGRVDSVYAKTATAAHERVEVEDTAVATLSFENGAIGNLVASTAAYDGLPVRIDIFGTEGSAIIEGDRLKLVKLKNGEHYASEQAAAHALSIASGGTASVKDDASRRPLSLEEGAVWGDAHRAQLEDFVRAIRTGTEPLINADEGRHPVEIILGIYESAKTGSPVRLRKS